MLTHYSRDIIESSDSLYFFTALRNGAIRMQMAINFLTLLLAATIISCKGGQDLLVTAVITNISYHKSRYHDATTIHCVIASPKSYQGLRMSISTKASSRKLLREEYPIGSIISFATSSSLAISLDSAREKFQNIEFQLDTGVDPYMISSVYYAPMIKLDELKSPIRKNNQL